LQAEVAFNAEFREEVKAVNFFKLTAYSVYAPEALNYSKSRN